MSKIKSVAKTLPLLSALSVFSVVGAAPSFENAAQAATVSPSMVAPIPGGVTPILRFKDGVLSWDANVTGWETSSDTCLTWVVRLGVGSVGSPPIETKEIASGEKCGRGTFSIPQNGMCPNTQKWWWAEMEVNASGPGGQVSETKEISLT